MMTRDISKPEQVFSAKTNPENIYLGNNEQSNGFNKENDLQTEQPGVDPTINDIDRAPVVNGDSSQQVKTEKNNNEDYKQLFELLSTIEGDSDVDESNVTETIQKKLKEKNLDMYQKWQGNQFDINYTFANQSTLLHIAAGGGFVEVTKLLIKKGADVNKTGLYMYTYMLKLSLYKY